MRRWSISSSGRRAITGLGRSSGPGAGGPARPGTRGDRAVVETEFPVEDKFKSLPKRPVVKAGGARTAFLTIQEGCDKFCAFCVVPYTRGAEYSRAVADVVAEAEALAANGVREITLLGQNVNAYHGAGPDGAEWGLGRLLFRLAEVPGLARLRYTTSHPRDMDDDAARRASRPRCRHALSASARAVRLRPRAEGHEPQAHGGRLPRARRPHPRRRGPTSRCRRISSSAFPARRRRSSRRRWRSRPAPSATRRPSRSNTRPGPARRPPMRAIRSPEDGEGRAPGPPQRAAERRPGRLRAILRRAHPRRAGREARPPSGPDDRPLALSSVRGDRGAREPLAGQIVPVRIESAGPNSLRR